MASNDFDTIHPVSRQLFLTLEALPVPLPDTPPRGPVVQVEKTFQEDDWTVKAGFWVAVVSCVIAAATCVVCVVRWCLGRKQENRIKDLLLATLEDDWAQRQKAQGKMAYCGSMVVEVGVDLNFDILKKK